MVNHDKIFVSIAAETDKRKLRKQITDAHEQNNREIMAHAANRIVELENFNPNGPLEQDVYQALAISESFTSFESGKTNLLNRSRNKLRKDGVKKFAKYILNPKTKNRQGFDILKKYNALEYSTEFIALRYPEHFTEKELSEAKCRLKHEGFPADLCKSSEAIRIAREKYYRALGFLDENSISDGGENRPDASNKSAQPETKDPVRDALNRAHTIRMFEIKMLWQRALYFWGFQGLIAFALGGTLESLYPACCTPTNKMPSSFHVTLALALSVLGFLTALGLVFMNKGSKFIQENWEFHIDMLEDGIEGKLHKTILSDSKICKKCGCSCCGCQRQFSVSKLNQIASEIFAGAWFFMSLGLLPLFHSPTFYNNLANGSHWWVPPAFIGFFALWMIQRLWCARSANTEGKGILFKQREIKSFTKR